MKNMTLRRIANVCGGILHLAEGMEYLADTEVTDITTDSRQAGEGSLFAAIVGERVDGHRFIPSVFEQGAYCVLSEQELTEPGGCWIKVLSTLQALKDIAQDYRAQLGIPVVGITGSVGKTSTKEVIASVLAQKYKTLKTQGNFNNELGVPLTIFRLREDDEIAVLEMGISDFGEMHRLAKIARPDTCVITNIGTCHLEFLGDRDGVLRAKTEIFDFLKEDGHIVLNGDDDRLIRVQNVKGIRPVFFGLGEAGRDGGNGPDAEKAWPALSVYADEIRQMGLSGTACKIHTPAGSFETLIPIPGIHMVRNALAAAAVGLAYGLTISQIDAGIRALESVSGRLHIIKTERYTLIDDCYNANPMSMKASLSVLQHADGFRAAVLGDMAELGPEEERFHAEVGAHAAACGIDLLIAAGRRSRALAQAASDNGAKQVFWYETLQALLDALPGLLPEGATVLVKASHCMEFEKVLALLQV